ncbi:MAG: DUF6051 family protein [Deltaproteobacteria bacterium]|jgi:hypothetical protein|nr:DUF6051 family protein [Deltaproteobacteria bacterium]
MLFHELHALLKSRVSLEPDSVAIPEAGLRVANFTFRSRAADLLENSSPGEPSPAAGDGPEDAADRELHDGVALARDSEIAENAAFRYSLMLPEGTERADGAVVLLHGLNERNWAKYLPWAAELCLGTGRAVLLFPIAFHMNRSPEAWTDTRLMRRVSRFRLKSRPETLHSALSNAAISARLSADPSRFFWSGLQTYRDVRRLAGLIRDGAHPMIAGGAGPDLFTYSIGTFLGEILMCADEEGLFSGSRLAAFCGGPVFNRLSPASKFIVDSVADVELYSFMVGHLESRERMDPRLRSHLSGESGGAGPWFRAFLDYRTDLERREARLRDLAPRIRAAALSGDRVVPPYEVMNTLQGAARDIPIPVDVLDPPYPCRHEDPFPAGGGKHAGAVDAAFRETFAKFREFLL